MLNVIVSNKPWPLELQGVFHFNQRTLSGGESETIKRNKFLDMHFPFTAITIAASLVYPLIYGARIYFFNETLVSMKTRQLLV